MSVRDITDPAAPLGMPPRLGEAAPDFSARSTAGAFQLSDYRGQWVVLMSHPADFTPVCSTEFVALARQIDAFSARNCTLVGLSIDSLFAHFAWLRALRDRFGVEVRFPIVEDPTLVIGRAYGMSGANDGDSATMRSTFFIDPDGVVRATTCYPANVGRSVTEMLRLLDALQTVDARQALAPADWQPGEPLMSQPASDLDRVFAAGTASGWFLNNAEPD